MDELFSPDRWDGSDVFMIWPFPKMVWITPQVAEVIQAEGFSGAEMKTFEDPEVRTLGIFEIGTRSLSHYMPANRAEQLEILVERCYGGRDER